MRGKTAVVTVGSINIDLVVQAARRPQPGETFTGNAFEIYVGGKGLNQAVQTALSGAPSFLVGRVGTDVFAPLVHELLQRTGVDATYISSDEAGCGIGHVVVDDQGDYSAVIVPRANGHVLPADVDRAKPALAASAILLLQLELPLPTVTYAATLARNMGLRVFLNAAPAAAIPAALMQVADVLVVNEIEAQMISGQAFDAEDAAAVLKLLQTLAAGQRAVVLTLGERGAWAMDRTGQRAHFASHHVKVVNTIGAGDAFIGEMAARMAEGASLFEAMPFAVAAGAVAVTHHAPHGSPDDANAIRQLIQALPTSH